MLKHYEKFGKEIFEHEFLGIAEFLRYLNEMPTSNFYEHCSSETGNYAFTKTNSYQEAEELCKFGYHEDFEKIVKLKNSIDKYLKITSTRDKEHRDFIGYAPDVKAFLEGNPLNMLNRVNPKRKKISLYYNVAYSGNISSKQIYNAGAIILSLIDVLEKMNYNVDLNLFDMTQCDGQVSFPRFVIKRENERSNLQKLYFPMCHPSFQRRLVFKLQEKTPGLNSSWASGYGKPCDISMIKQMLELDNSNIVITQPSEMGVSGNDILDDASNMFEIIDKSNKCKVLTLPTFEKKR
ncbi:MAG: hypothetical protein PHX04_02605 [Bacilli bacterium]|nr:hypothetical protein [Bacilli bacterium]